MLNSHQVEVIAALGDGFVVHARPDCIPEWDAIQELTDAKDGYIPDYRRFWELAESEFGYQPLIRFSIHEWESSNWDDLEYGDYGFDIDPNTMPDYQGETVTATNGEQFDVSTYVGVFCDSCGERIE